MSLREYTVTLKSKDDLDSFYYDMEKNVSRPGIPLRAIEVTSRRPMSRNTNYMLTEKEAADLLLDERVEAVELSIKERGLEVGLLNFVQNPAGWSKSFTTQPSDLNWGLIRCYMEKNIAGWGFTSDNSSLPSIKEKLELSNIGRNVDVVILDGIAPIDHPEYAKNINGTGGSRIVRYNWFQHNPVVNGTAASVYPYSTIENTSKFDGSNHHGTHVASIACGITQGWAKGANIYNLFSGAFNPEEYIDYIRAFHKNKPINPATGRKNPTVVNMSFTMIKQMLANQIVSVNYRGQTANRPASGWSQATLDSFGIVGVIAGSNDVSTLYTRVAGIDADMIDATNEGIIMVGAAGNNKMLNANPGDADYNNFLVFNNGETNETLYYHRGPSQGAAPTAICVGSIDILAIGAPGGFSIKEAKSDFSCTGPRNDVFAPGSMIMGAYANEAYETPAVKDQRNGNYYLNKVSGTSQASPQVAGIIACLLESNPSMTQEDVLQWIKKTCENGVVFDRANSYTDDRALQNAPNRYIKFKLGRPIKGLVHPRYNVNDFTNTKVVYPKTKIRRKG